MFKGTVRTYLRELNPEAYNRMVKEGTLEEVLDSIAERMEDHFQTISDQLEKADPMENKDIMKDVAKLNTQRHQAIEMVQAMIEEEVRAW